MTKLKPPYLAIDPPYFGYAYTMLEAKRQLVMVGGNVKCCFVIQCTKMGKVPLAGLSPNFAKGTETRQ